MATQKKKLSLSLVEDRINQMPLLPAVVCELMQLNSSSDDFFDKVSELAAMDPPLAATVLKNVNSAAAHPAHQISNLNEALIRIGADKILSYISTLSVARVFTPTTTQQKSIWKHSIEVALLAEFIAQQCPKLETDSQLAYLCGLLHDLGRFILFEITSKAIDVIDSKHWQTPQELSCVENKILGFTHAEVGSLAAAKWNLPQQVRCTILLHHDQNIWHNRKIDLQLKNLITIVQLADSISILIKNSPEWAGLNDEAKQQLINSACLAESWPDLALPTALLVKQLADIEQHCQKILTRLCVPC